MNKLIFSLIAVLLACQSEAQNQWTVSSPDKLHQLVLSLNKGNLTYQVLSGKATVVQPSVMGIESRQERFSNNLSFVRTTSRGINEQYSLLIGKRKENKAVGQETSVVFKTKSNSLLQVDMRAYNDGVAFRYSFPDRGKKLIITGEQTQFVIPTNGKAWMQNYDIPTDYTPAYEGVFANGIPIGSNAKDSGGWALPALFQTGNHWLLIAESNLDKNYFGIRLDSNCTGGIYKATLPMASEAKGVGSIHATATTPFATPWRVFILGRNPGAIVESNLVHHLAAPNKIGNADWVKPGRASWSWWGDHESSRSLQKLKNFVDLAKEMGWEYSLVDANWNILQGGGTIQDLVQYANAKGIGLLFWYNSGGPHNVVTEQPRDIMHDPVKRKAEFKKLREWGVKGIKVDFFQSDKQSIIQQYHDILVDAAREQLMVNFHGCTMPRGWSRTYPNLVSMEAVRGAENYGWGKEYARDAPFLNNIYTYTRNVVGPMDYTPVTFSDYECCPHTTTNAHELALSVLFETGILHFADRAAPYQSLDAKIKDFLRTVPVTWDDTRWIEGEPGKGTILARRSGNVWYLAGSNGENVRKSYSLHLPFLSKQAYKAVFFYDGSTPRTISTDEKILKKEDAVVVDVLPNGGFVVVLEPKE
jgi:hypothetical protein